MFTSLDPGAIGVSVSFEEALQLAQDAGFEGLDLPLKELLTRAQQTSIQEIKERLQQAQLQPGAWGLPVDFRGDEESYQTGLAQLPAYAELAQALGSSRCSTWILPFSDTRDYQSNMEFHANRLRPIARILANHGQRFGLEFVGPKTMRNGHQYEFISTIAGALELGQQIGTGNTGLLLDSYHWFTSHGTVADIQHLSNQQVVYVHVNDAPASRDVDEQIDSERLLPGASGVIDIAGFLQALQSIGYDGPVVVEPFNAEHRALPYAERVKATRASLAKIWQQAGIKA
ncbi:sugar phosphate isomerase/epimerase family protein [Dictyobacter aurantiacus]|uniref:Sugar phosphate isomerase n=1 Tax=Dictyobacter aurantiacus TaxID=1936993 RepID=A0A401Z934_9CHLR|nr:sugar phosphate isomerase/epimerase [Dictyobacter aurantiacus]GCE03328.1 sugar phosphate isomerase [Dictyobacter aurantiacus]